ncbi:extensin family protein [Phenylobacterium sp.]|uniref:extensin-like domain-containing protein n=1 Tax=Phenylobacterium sp. TaxID=1871053 RepID=UPI0027305B33|nr:extensin family protein [Phenylobacterium sp.]MDP1874375.1 extensin family protein [Phenylobacterium sp.]MDP3489464.1 extensin family protein [Phenylobacterium sp.]
MTRPPWLPPLKPASAEALAFGGLWAFLLDMSLLAIGLVWAIDAFAPPQDLPWKPLALSDPPGLATVVKFQRAASDPALCREVLAAGGIAFTEEPDRVAGTCPLTNTVRLRDGVTPLAPAAPVMTCPLALSYAFWDRHVLGPATQAVMETDVARVEHYGVFACRNVYGRSEGRVSEHASANALDVAAIVLEDGRRLSVLGDFNDADDGGTLMRAIRTGACDYFRSVLSPDYNAAHADHLHLDYGRFGICR